MALYSLFADVTAPTNPNAETIGVTLGTEIVCQPGWLMGYRYVRPSTAMNGPLTAAFYNPATGTADAGTVVNSITPGPPGWNEVLLPTPVFYAAEVRRRAAVHHPSGRYAFLNNAFATDGTWPAGRTNGPLFAPPSNATVNGQGLFVAGASIAMPTNMFDETFYYVDIIWSDVDPVGREGTGATTATAALAGTGSKSTAGSSSLAGTAVLASAGSKSGTGVAELSAVTLLAATGTAQHQGTGAIAAAATIEAAIGETHRTGTGTLTGTAELASAGQNPDNVPDDWDYRLGPPYTDSFRLGPPHL